MAALRVTACAPFTVANKKRSFRFYVFYVALRAFVSDWLRLLYFNPHFSAPFFAFVTKEVILAAVARAVAGFVLLLN